MFHVKHSYRFSQDYLSETWPLQPAGRVWARRIAGADPMIEGHRSDPIGRGPCLIWRSVRRISFSSGRGSRNPVQVFFGKTGGFPPIRDFLLKIRSRFGDRVLRFFGNFRQKPQKMPKKYGLRSSWWPVTGLEDGELLENCPVSGGFGPFCPVFRFGCTALGTFGAVLEARGRA